MKRILVMMLAASGLVPAAAAAQPRTVEPPVKWEDVPRAQIRTPGAYAPTPPLRPYAPPPQTSQTPLRSVPVPPVVTRHGPVQVHANGDRTMVRHHRGDGRGWRGHRGYKNYSGYRRFDRGYVLPHAWWGPGFQISNWSAYGLPAPVRGGRWVRYYDDALMIDGQGRVHDGRWGMAWDEWQDEWAYDGRGVPVYVGNGEFYPDDEDYAWVEGSDGYSDGHADRYSRQGGGYAYGAPCSEACAYPPPPPPYPYAPGYGYGWGWGYGAGMVVTETIVTTAPSVVTESWVEEEVVHERRAHKPRKYRAKPRRPQPMPRPYGERG